jgi:ComF family protein
MEGCRMRMSGRSLVTAMRAVLHLVLPCRCALCGSGCADVVCGECRAAYAGAARPRCYRCANPLPPAPSRGDDVIVCGGCLRTPRAFDATVAAVDYAPPLDQIVLALKFGARLPLAPWCARTLRDAVLARPGLPLPDLLCPVPLGGARLRERGFNQALEIARPLAALLGIALYPQLAARTLETRAQSGTTPAERARNVAGAFTVLEPGLVTGRHVGLVDDVMTSGHTLDALAIVCKRAGAVRVTNLVFARTPPS